MTSRLRATAACASPASATPAPSRATATIWSKDTGPVPTRTLCCSLIGSLWDTTSDTAEATLEQAVEQGGRGCSVVDGDDGAHAVGALDQQRLAAAQHVAAGPAQRPH